MISDYCDGQVDLKLHLSVGQVDLKLHLSVGQVILFPYFDHCPRALVAGRGWKRTGGICASGLSHDHRR